MNRAEILRFVCQKKQVQNAERPKGLDPPKIPRQKGGGGQGGGFEKAEHPLRKKNGAFPEDQKNGPKPQEGEGENRERLGPHKSGTQKRKDRQNDLEKRIF